MEHEIHVVRHVDELAAVGVLKPEGVVPKMFDVLQRPRIQVVEADHPMPLFEQVLAEMGPEESRSAGHD